MNHKTLSGFYDFYETVGEALELSVVPPLDIIRQLDTLKTSSIPPAGLPARKQSLDTFGSLMSGLLIIFKLFRAVGPRGQQPQRRGPDFSFPSHLFHLLQENPKVFPAEKCRSLQRVLGFPLVEQSRITLPRAYLCQYRLLYVSGSLITVILPLQGANAALISKISHFQIQSSTQIAP